MLTSRTGVSLLTLSLALSLAACGGAGEESADEATVSPDGRVTRDVETWSLASDPYGGVDFGLTQYAWELAVSDCMEAQGQDFEVVTYDWNLPPDPTHNAAGRRLFTEAIAAAYGYHTAPDPGDYARRLRERDARSPTDPVWQASFSTCAEQVTENPPVAVAEDSDIDILALSGAEEPDVVEAAGAWRECMAPQGIPDLPERPEGMPGPTLSAEFGLDVIDPVNGSDTNESVPVSSRELEVAVADARCWVSSGYRDAYYEAEWRNDYEFVEANGSELAAQLERDQQVTADLIAYIRNHA